MTTFQKAALLESMQKLDYDMRLRKYPAVLEAEAEQEAEERWPRHMTAEDAQDYIDDCRSGRR